MNGKQNIRVRVIRILEQRRGGTLKLTIVLNLEPVVSGRQCFAYRQIRTINATNVTNNGLQGNNFQPECDIKNSFRF